MEILNTYQYEGANSIMNISRGINHIGMTVPDIEEATSFFKKGLDGKIAYDSLTKQDEPRGGKNVEKVLYLSKGARIIHKKNDGIW